MTGTLSLSVLALVAFCILTEMGREVCFKFAADRAPDILRTLLLPVTWLGVAFWVVDLFCWMQVLERVPLSIAFPLTALSYAAMVFAGAIFFSEKVNQRHAFGVFLITLGVACVGLTGL
ncbi:EamA family transporter [Ochrobactrum sp. Q0168]|uniref:EamA family transporter n=1 Tax=Ochrobactrum sp. Q0168 TaxID=2793241 RepID=UPI0018EE2DEE|nr:EamA family transporter [Ochrobactrum sp. Q0168]